MIREEFEDSRGQGAEQKDKNYKKLRLMQVGLMH